MKRRLIALIVAAGLMGAASLHAETQSWFGFEIGIRGGSPAPRPIEWRSEPSVVWVGHVAVVDHDACYDDVFRCDQAWWRMSDGWWYRSSSWRGPWVGVDVRRVPRTVLELPAGRWKHHPHGGPPGQMKKMRREEYREAVREDRHDHGRGHDRGHGRD
jgi:hypothetical protein